MNWNIKKCKKIYLIGLISSRPISFNRRICRTLSLLLLDKYLFILLTKALRAFGKRIAIADSSSQLTDGVLAENFGNTTFTSNENIGSYKSEIPSPLPEKAKETIIEISKTVKDPLGIEGIKRSFPHSNTNSRMTQMQPM